MIKWICCSCNAEFNEYPSNSICPECGNEDDFEETNDICNFDRCMFIEHNKCRHVDQESCQYLKAIQKISDLEFNIWMDKACEDDYE